MAEVMTEVNNYDQFALLVEVGSCLGLWLGLSLIDFLDLIVNGHKRIAAFLPWKNKIPYKMQQSKCSVFPEKKFSW